MKRSALLFIQFAILTQFASAQSVTLTLPTSGATYVDNMLVSYTISEPEGTPTNRWLTFTATLTNSPYYSNTYVLVLAMTNTPFSFNPSTVTANTNFLSVTPNTNLPDTTYSIFMSYERPVSLTNVNSATKTGVRTDTATLPPTLVSPTNGTYTTNVPIYHYAAESFVAGSSRLTFEGPQTNVIQYVNLVRTNLYTLNIANITNSYGGITSVTTNTLTDGTYSVYYTYRDTSGHGAATSSIHTVTIDSITQTPTLNAPTNDSLQSIVLVDYTLPETALTDSVKLNYIGPVTGALSITETAAGTTNFTWNPTTNSLVSGAYTLSLSYQDVFGNSAVTSAPVTNVMIDVSTEAPILTQPVSDSIINVIPVDYTLPETPGAGTVQLSFVDVITTNVIALLTMDEAPTNAFMWTPSTDPALLSGVVSASTNSLPDGLYDITLTYQDLLGNPGGSTIASNVTVDTITDAPTINHPQTANTYAILPINYTLPDAALANSVQMIFSGSTTVTFHMIDTTPAGTAYIDPRAIPTNTSPLVSATSNAIPEGIYDVTLQYQDALGNPAAMDTVLNVTIDVTNEPPTLILPTNNASVSQITVEYTIPETPQPNSIALTFTGPQTGTLYLADFVGTTNFTWDTHTDPALTISQVTGATLSSLMDGVYSVSLSYNDLLTNVIATTITNITIDTVTTAPTLSTPASFSTVSQITVEYTIPETPAPNSIALTFTGPQTGTLYLADFTGTTNFSWNPHTDPTQTIALVTSSTLSSLTDGVYSIYLAYQDSLSNPAAIAMATNVTIDTVTQSPTLTYPADNTSYSAISVQYTLPETPQAGAVQLIFFGTQTVTLTMNTSLSNSFTWNPQTDPALISSVVSASAASLADGTYSVLLSYQDVLGNPAATVISTNVLIDSITQSPTLIYPESGAAYTNLPISYVLPENHLSGSVQFSLTGPTNVILTMNDGRTNSTSWNPATSPGSVPGVFSATPSISSLPEGYYTMSLSYRDAFPNVAATTEVTNVRILIPPQTTDVVELATVLGTNLTLSCAGKSTWIPTLLLATNLYSSWVPLTNGIYTFTNDQYTMQIEQPTNEHFFLRIMTTPAP